MRARADADLHRVDAGFDRAPRWPRRGDVAGDELDVRERSFACRRTASSTPLRVTVRGVDDDHVAPGLRAAAATRSSRSGPDPDRRAARGAGPCRPSRRSGCGLGLLDVLDGDQAAELALLVDHEQLLDAVLVEQLLAPLLRRSPSRAVTSFLVISSSTGWSRLRLEAHVAAGEDADQPSGRDAPGRRRCRACASARAPRWSGGLGLDGHRVDDHPALGLLHPLDLARPDARWARFLWRMPMPPSRAMAMAVAASVTVSIAAERSGMFRRRLRVSRVASSTSLGKDVDSRPAGAARRRT